MNDRMTMMFRSLSTTCCYASLASIVAAMPFVAASASAQSAAPVATPAPDVETAARSAAQQQLTQALGFIAEDGSNWFALSQAGRAALALGDARAAAGFLTRAEALAPRDPVIKAALGAAMVQLEDPVAALRYFDSAVATGGLDRGYLGDRGLAFDLLGNQARAQADYAVAQATHPSAELTRRWAISLGISGRTDQAVQMLVPLLRAQDRAAWRARAMIVAMNGRPEEARQIARTTMPPQLAQAIDPYWPLMDRLTPAQLASASHFGRFPTYEARQRPDDASGADRQHAQPLAAGGNHGRSHRSPCQRCTARNNGGRRNAATACRNGCSTAICGTCARAVATNARANANARANTAANARARANARASSRIATCVSVCTSPATRRPAVRPGPHYSSASCRIACPRTGTIPPGARRGCQPPAVDGRRIVRQRTRPRLHSARLRAARRWGSCRSRSARLHHSLCGPAGDRATGSGSGSGSGNACADRHHRPPRLVDGKSGGLDRDPRGGAQRLGRRAVTGRS
jgi:Flp pilus assembly protein TadD